MFVRVCTSSCYRPRCSSINTACVWLQVVMSDPVLLVDDGLSYQREALAAWLAEHDTSPVTGAQLAERTVLDNHALRNLIAASRRAA